MSNNANVGPASVYLFIGIESENWSLADFETACTFCLDHSIDGLIVKVYEVTQGDWYTSIGGAQAVADVVTSHHLRFMPYGFFYGNSTQECDAIVRYGTSFDSFILDMESTWNNASSLMLAPYLTAIQKVVTSHHNIDISTFADPAEQGWTSVVDALEPYVGLWMPQIYSEELDTLAAKEWPSTLYLLPTYSVIDVNSNGLFDTALIQKGVDVSIWEYADAEAHPAWVDTVVSIVKDNTVTQQQQQTWFEYPVCVPFGNPNYDVALGGSHDMDVQCPPNTPITNIVNGTICDISSPSWGMQVGIQFDTPVNGNPYMAYLHLSAVNPSLSVGSHVGWGDLIGWSGGCTSASQYDGTSNPTGSNFLDDPSMSSQPQCGIAMMEGPVYGSGAGWVVWPTNPNVDHSNDMRNPTILIQNALDAIQSSSPTPQPPVPPSPSPVNKFQQQQYEIRWGAMVATVMQLANDLKLPMPPAAEWPSIPMDTGIAAAAKQVGFNCPISFEYPTVDWNGVPIIEQLFLMPGGVIDFYGKTGQWRAWDVTGKEITPQGEWNASENS